jgi:hypothetical protein
MKKPKIKPDKAYQTELTLISAVLSIIDADNHSDKITGIPSKMHMKATYQQCITARTKFPADSSQLAGLIDRFISWYQNDFQETTKINWFRWGRIVSDAFEIVEPLINPPEA